MRLLTGGTTGAVGNTAEKRDFFIAYKRSICYIYRDVLILGVSGTHVKHLDT